MENKKLVDNQSTPLQEIQRDGNALNPISFVKSVIEFDKINNLPIVEVKNNLGIIFSEVAVMAGIKDPIQSINKRDIVELILTRFNSLSLQEIYYAFKLERYGEYDVKTEHYQLFNAEYVAQVLNKYKKWRQKIRFENNLPIQKLEQMPQLTQQEKDDLTYTGVVNCFDKYVQDKYIINGYVWVYDHLHELKILHPEKESKLSAMKIAKRNLQQKAKENPNPSVTKKVMSDLEKKNSSAVIVEAKRLLLEQFFAELLNKNKSIKNILDEAI